MSQPTLPGDRPRWAVRIVRTVQAALAALALAVLAWTAAVRPNPQRLPTSPVLIVPDTTIVPAGYTPTPAGPPCPAAGPQGVSR